MTDVYLEQGRTWTFACAVDWPGWARRGKGDEAALAALRSYADRYAAVVPDFTGGELHVVGVVPGNATTDFGAPAAFGPWDDVPVDQAVRERLADQLGACWAAFDRIAAHSPAELRKGPRGGGRDRDGIVGHVQETERAYGRKIEVKVPPGTSWAVQRDDIEAGIRSGNDRHEAEPTGGRAAAWPVPYAVRRLAWHVLDHAWEIQDKDPGAARSG